MNGAKYLLRQLGFIKSKKGKTSGSRVKFFRTSDRETILMHKTHPSDVMNYKSTYGLATFLTRIGELHT